MKSLLQRLKRKGKNKEITLKSYRASLVNAERGKKRLKKKSNS